MSWRKALRRKKASIHCWYRMWSRVAWGFVHTRHPLLVHLIPTRRCNLTCTYCNEFDDFSAPVPTEEMFWRIDRLAEFGTSVITISGGEPSSGASGCTASCAASSPTGTY